MCHKHSCQMNWSPHPLTVRAQSQGHLTHHIYNSTGLHRPTQLPIHHYNLWTQVQVPVVQESSLWPKPSAGSHRSPQQKAKINARQSHFVYIFCRHVIFVVFVVHLLLTVGVPSIPVIENFPLGTIKSTPTLPPPPPLNPTLPPRRPPPLTPPRPPPPPTPSLLPRRPALTPTLPPPHPRFALWSKL